MIEKKENIKKKYEKPSLKELSEEKAYGRGCAEGSSAVEYCSCGYLVLMECQNGGGATYYCRPGNMLE